MNLWRTWYAVVAASPGLGPYLVSRRRPFSWFLGLGRPNLSSDVKAVYAERMADPARARARLPSTATTFARGEDPGRPSLRR